MVRELAAQGKAVQESGKYVVDLAALGYDKLLGGGGSINEPIMVRAAAASASAIEKIRKAGGEVVIQRGLLH